ncbi:MAG: CAP domain-containing protein [Thermomicrobiales bacterium]
MVCPSPFAGTLAENLAQLVAEEAVLCLVNEARADAGVPALTLNPLLRAAARQHAADARTLKWWDGGGPKVHINPVTGSTPQDRIRDAGYCGNAEEPVCNENAFDAWWIGAAGGTEPQAAVDWWLGSPDHHDTMLDPTFNETGIAVILGVPEKEGNAANADGGAIYVQTFGFCEEPIVLGRVWSWGKNIQGALGDGSTTDRHLPQQLEGPVGVAALAGGGAHTLALTGGGEVLAWGHNALGQLGDGTTTNHLNPTAIGLTDVQAIAAGNSHSLALMRDKTLWSWGANFFGQLGDGSGADRPDPAEILDASLNITAISAGWDFCLALRADGRVLSWGANNWGQLGNGSTDSVDRPEYVHDLDDIVAIAAGFEHALALARNGQVWAWGSNHSGQLGDNSGEFRQLTPVPVMIPAASGRIVALGGGGFHSLALEQNGRVWAWGGNGYGQLGTGTTTDSPVPVRPLNVFDVSAIAVGFGHNLVLKNDGAVWAWGYNTYGGPVGDGTTFDRKTPVQVQGLQGIAAVAAGTHHSLAI